MVGVTLIFVVCVLCAAAVVRGLEEDLAANERYQQLAALKEEGVAGASTGDSSSSFSIIIISSGSESKQPEPDPSITISIISSGSMAKPTMRPSRAPTPAPPTAPPSVQTVPIVEFTSTLTLSNVFNPQLDNPAKLSLAEAVCGSLKIATTDCSFVSFELVSAPTASPTTPAIRRHLMNVLKEEEKRAEAEQIEELEELQAVDLAASTPTRAPTARPVYGMIVQVHTSTITPSSFLKDPSGYISVLSSSLALSVSSGTFNNQLKAYSVANGASSTYKAIAQSVQIEADGIESPSSASNVNASGLSSGGVAGVVIGVLLGVALLVVGGVYYYKTYLSKYSYRYYHFEANASGDGPEGVAMKEPQVELATLTQFNSIFRIDGEDVSILDEEASVAIGQSQHYRL